jgi:uncharacterized protein (DUF1778 family)
MTKKILDESDPSSEAGDRAMRLTKAALGPVVATGAAIASGAAVPVAPVLAAMTTYIVEELWLPHLRMREESIIEDVVARLQNVDRTVLESAAFIDALNAGVQAAIKTSSQTKREALRNAIVNSVGQAAPHLVKQQQFFALTDRYSELHLMLLDLFGAGGPSASRWYQREHADLNSPVRGVGVITSAAKMAEKVFHEHDLEFIRHVWSQLVADGLARAPLDNGAEGDIAHLKRTTTLGDEYLAFIRE